MAEIKLRYYVKSNLTITLANLAHDAARESTAVDNTSNLYEGGKLLVQVETGATTPGSDRAVYVYVYGNDGGSTYPDRCSGSDASVALDNPTNLDLIGVISCLASGTQYRKLFDLSEIWPSGLPSKWGVVLKNRTGYALSGTAGNNFVSFQPTNHQSV